MAAGDILSVVIHSSGEYAEITIAGRATGGAYALGLAAPYNRVIDLSSLPRITFTVTSLGYNPSTGSLGTLTRLIYGTCRKRKESPNQADADETVSGSDVIVRIWLSEPIYAKDQSGAGNSGTDVTYSIASGFYTVSATVNNAGSGTATNNSTAAYPLPNAYWGDAAFQRITSATSWRVRVLGAAHGAKNGCPVACWEFSAVDEHSHTQSTRVSVATVDLTMGDQCPVPEGLWDMPTNTFTQGDKVTVHCVVKGILGDLTMDSSAATALTGAAAPSPQFGPHELLYDGSATYGITMALVDASAGSDAGALTVYDSAAFNPATAYKFLTIAKAARAIRDYNNANHARDDVGGGVIYCNAGNYAWLGATIAGAYGSTPKTWITVTPANGVSRSSVVINATSGNTNISGRVRLLNLKLQAPVNTFLNIPAIWTDTCEFDISVDNVFRDTSRVGYATRCLVTQFRQGFRPGVNENFVWGLVRGCDLSGLDRGIMCYAVVGNIATGTKTLQASLFIDNITASGPLQPLNQPFVCCNKIMGRDCTNAPILTFAGSLSMPYGFTIAQNLFEAINGFSVGMMDLCAGEGGTVNTPCNYGRVWKNIFVGLKTQIAYNSSGSTQKDRRYWEIFGNMVTDWNIKVGLFPTADTARIGSNGLANGVGVSCNVNLESVGENGSEQVAAGGSFAFEFEGPNSYEPTKTAMVNGTSQAQSCGTSLQTYPRFKTYAAYRGQTSGAGAGNGDYHYKDDALSPFVQMKAGRRIFPVDLEGRSTAENDPPGPYAWQHPGQMSGAM